MTAMVDMTGQRIGRLYVVRREGNSVRGLATWLCQCVCGKQCVREGSELRRGKIHSCGCTRLRRHTRAAYKMEVTSQWKT